MNAGSGVTGVAAASALAAVFLFLRPVAVLHWAIAVITSVQQPVVWPLTVRPKAYAAIAATMQKVCAVKCLSWC